MIARILRNSASLAFAQISMKAAGLIVTILIARALHADGCGRFASAWSFGVLVGVLSDGGLSYFVALEVSRVPRTARRFAWTALAIRSVLAVIALTIAAISLPFLHFDGSLAIAAMVFSVSAIIDGLAAQVLSYYRAMARMHVEAQVMTAGRVALVVTTGIALIIHASVLSFAIAQTIASIIGFGIAIRSMHRDVAFIKPRVRALRAVGVGALPFAASGLLTYIFFRIDTLLLRAFGVLDNSIGAYSAAYRVMEASRTAFGSIAASVLPAATSLSHPSSRPKLVALGKTSVTLVLWSVAPMVLVFALAPKTVVGLIFGHGYDSAATLLMVLSPMPILMALDAVFGALINSLGGQKRLTVTFAVCAIVNVGLNIWLIPHQGALGAAFATIATEAVELCTLTVLVWRMLGDVRPALGWLAVAFGAAAASGALLPDGYVRAVICVSVFAAIALFVHRGRRRMAIA